ncbi:hypothetical protein Esi_0433_0016 [Ectocarpus siliculosus]|uniref:Uncharacterized protein n=1 Tax=Ectocarpus siliculosus TaxID=2880 RepID=D7G145_ECTSI|nr:hypothetical protein Esi_0433_0016 [Ectocarpus siliculosus]|eukprot:CBJ33155.1 hypothetical protein Esi_0433_0016 [Ectocarpus siliculosus]
MPCTTTSTSLWTTVRLTARRGPSIQKRGAVTGNHRSCRRCRGGRHHCRQEIPPADGNLRRGRGQGPLS